MYKLLGAVAVLFMAGSVEAGEQPSVGVGVGIGDVYHSSTAAEGYLRGRGAVLTGGANYLEALGNYQNLHQQARRRAQDNWSHGIRTRWSIKDESQARRRASRPNYIVRRTHTLDMIEARALLTQREDEMRTRGLLPPKPVPGFTHKGVRYKSYAEFKTTPAYQVFLAECDVRFAKRDAEKAAEKARYDSAVRFLARRARMNPISRVFHDEKVARDRRVRSIMGKEWWDKHMSNSSRR